MRDLPRAKFERALVGMGFACVLAVDADGLFFIAHDGLRVSPVLHPGTVRVDRRQTLARMARARRRQPHPAKSEATGAATPVASSVTTP